MPISDIVDLAITTAAAGPTQKGFGKPMILGYSQRFPERLRSYRSVAEMAADGFLTTDPEYIAASKLEAQNPRVEQWAIGRGNNLPTGVVRVTVVQTLNLTKYSLKVDGVEVSFTSDANATTAEIIAGLIAAITALGKAVTMNAPVGQSYFDITANTAGAFFSFEVVDVALLALNNQHADPGVAADLAAIQLYDDTWYGLGIAGMTSSAMIMAAAAWIETAKKLYVPTTNDTASITSAVGGGDVLDLLKTTNYGRSAGFYHPSPRDFLGIATMGNRLPYTPGSETWKFARVAGVSTTKLTTTHQNNLNAKRANYFYEVSGVSFVAEGKVAANEYIDKVRGIDWQEVRIGERVFGSLASAQTKVPMTDEGAQVVGGAVLMALRDGVANGLLERDPGPSVSVPKISTVSTTDKGNRLLPGVLFSGRLAGAIHKVQIRGNLSI